MLETKNDYTIILIQTSDLPAANGIPCNLDVLNLCFIEV